MPYSRAQYISNNFNNSLLNVALPIILNGIEELAKSEREGTLGLTQLPIDAYEMLKHSFCRYYGLENLNWGGLLLYINFYGGNNFLKNEMIFTPVLRFFITKQKGLKIQEKLEIIEQALKRETIEINDEILQFTERTIAQIHEHITQKLLEELTHAFNPENKEINEILESIVQKYGQNSNFLNSLKSIAREELAKEDFKAKISAIIKSELQLNLNQIDIIQISFRNLLNQKKEQLYIQLSKIIKDLYCIQKIGENAGNYNPITIEDAWQLLYKPFKITYHLRFSGPVFKANEKHTIYILQDPTKANKFIVDAEAYDIDCSKLEETYEHEKSIVSDYYDYSHLLTYVFNAPSYRCSHFTHVMLGILKYVISAKSQKNNQEVMRVIDNIRLQYYGKKYDEFLSQEGSAAAALDHAEPRFFFNQTFIEDAEETRLNSQLNFVELAAIISLSLMATTALAAAIIFCPPIGIAATLGIAAGSLWFGCAAFAISSGILGYSAYCIFFSHHADNNQYDDELENDMLSYA